MSQPDLELLLLAMGSPDTCFVLGAGASAPHVPTMGQLPARIAAFAPLLSSFSTSPQPPSPLRELIRPTIDGMRTADTIEAVWAGTMNAGAIAVVLERLIAWAHAERLPQYDVFHLFSRASPVVSFNWDGLSWARCPQRELIHPHGCLGRSPFLVESIEQALDWVHWDDRGDFRELVLPDLVMPGEEDEPRFAAMRERVLQTWLKAQALVVIGYSFGLGSPSTYDRVWLDAFVEAMRERKDTAIHVVSPDALRIASELGERAKRRINVFAWPLQWDLLARSVLRRASERDARSVTELLGHGEQIRAWYNALEEGGGGGR